MPRNITESVIKAIVRKDYLRATRMIRESLNHKKSAALARERQALCESDVITDYVGICPKCKYEYPYNYAILTANMGDDTSPCCGVKLQRTNSRRTFKLDADGNLAEAKLVKESYDSSVAALVSNMKDAIAQMKKDGTVGCSDRNLRQVTSTRGVDVPNQNTFERAFQDALDQVRPTLKGFRIYPHGSGR